MARATPPLRGAGHQRRRLRGKWANQGTHPPPPPLFCPAPAFCSASRASARFSLRLASPPPASSDASPSFPSLPLSELFLDSIDCSTFLEHHKGAPSSLARPLSAVCLPIQHTFPNSHIYFRPSKLYVDFLAHEFDHFVRALQRRLRATRASRTWRAQTNKLNLTSARLAAMRFMWCRLHQMGMAPAGGALRLPTGGRSSKHPCPRRADIVTVSYNIRSFRQEP